MTGIWKKINSNFSFKPRQKGRGLLTWTAAFNVYVAIDLKVTVQEGIRISIDSGVRKKVKVLLLL
jgi:hypothetical protein